MYISAEKVNVNFNFRIFVKKSDDKVVKKTERNKRKDYFFPAFF